MGSLALSEQKWKRGGLRGAEKGVSGMGGEDEGETSVRLKIQLIKFKNDMLIKMCPRSDTRPLPFPFVTSFLSF